MVSTTRRRGSKASHSLSYQLIGRFVAAAVGVGITALTVFMIWHYVDSYAQHLCGWPATISCSQGPAVWWLVPLGLAAIATVAILGLGRWVLLGRPWATWLLVVWIVGLLPVVIRMGPRRFGPDDLWVDAVYVLIGVGLAGTIAVAAAPQQRRWITRVTIFILAFVAVVAISLPFMLSG